MKSSTLRRANLSKEKIAVLEALAKYRRQTYENNSETATPQIKQKELDLLWKSFKQHNRDEKSPVIYLATGFIAGAIAMLVLVMLVNLSINTVSNAEFSSKPAIETKDTSITFIPADNKGAVTTANSSSEVYSVQSGDTLESIIIRFYGSYSKTREKNVMEANSMKNPNALQIGQKLVIPLGQ